jgi:hypothetical protein
MKFYHSLATPPQEIMPPLRVVPPLSRGRLKIAVRDMHTFKLTMIDQFDSKAELIDANMASAHIPFFLDWRLFAKYRYLVKQSIVYVSMSTSCGSVAFPMIGKATEINRCLRTGASGI